MVGISDHPASVTALLIDWGRGNEAALARLIPLVHGELHEIARRHMGHERAGHSLQATALVNETYFGSSTPMTSTGTTARISWRSPPGSCAAFSSTMRGRGGRRSVAAMRQGSRSTRRSS